MYGPAPQTEKELFLGSFLSTFLVQQFERDCCLYMPPYFTIRQCHISSLALTFNMVFNQKKKKTYLTY